MRCPACASLLDAKGHCEPCTRGTLAKAGFTIGNALGLSSIGKLLCAATAAALPEILGAIEKVKTTMPERLPTQAELDEALKKLAPQPTVKA